MSGHKLATLGGCEIKAVVGSAEGERLLWLVWNLTRVKTFDIRDRQPDLMRPVDQDDNVPPEAEGQDQV